MWESTRIKRAREKYKREEGKTEELFRQTIMLSCDCREREHIGGRKPPRCSCYSNLLILKPLPPAPGLSAVDTSANNLLFSLSLSSGLSLPNVFFPLPSIRALYFSVLLRSPLSLSAILAFLYHVSTFNHIRF